MQVYILNTAYEIVGMIDAAESVLWNKKYNDVGESEIYLPCDEYFLELLRNGHYLYRYDDDMFCKIESNEITTDAENGDHLIATGKDICTILSGRIVRLSTVYSGTVAGFVEKLLTDNVINPEQGQRKIPNFTIDTSNFAELTERIDVSVFTDDLLQTILSTCKSAGYGFRVSYDIERGKLVSRLYKGKNKAKIESDEYIEFSPAFSNILSSNYKRDESTLKNVVYVGYKAANSEEVHLLSMFNGETEPQGEGRREVYVDGTGTSRDITYEELLQMFPSVSKTTQTVDEKVVSTYSITSNGETVNVATSEGAGEEEKITVTDYTYLLLIRALGNNTLSEWVETEEFSGDVDTIDTYAYKTDYDLGDIVKVINDYGIEAEATITEIMESDDPDNGYVVEPKFEYINFKGV